MDGEGVPGSPVFIVGLARSGTTLMAVCLDRHPVFSCGPETHLLRAIATPEGVRALQSDHWPDAAVDLVCSVRGDRRPVHEEAGLDRAAIHAFLSQRAPSVRALMESITVPQAVAAGAQRWVEKTPGHLGHIRTIRAEWPDAAIIRMVRDPRDRAVSIAAMPFGADTQVRALIDGQRREAQAWDAVATDPRLLTVRLEDLVADAETELRRVCSFLGESYEPAMLDTTRDSTAAATDAGWKERALGPIAAVLTDGPGTRMDAATARFAALLCAREMERDGYPGARAVRGRVMVVPGGGGIAREDESLLVGLAASDLVVEDRASWRLGALRSADALLAWSAPGASLMPRTGSPTGWRATAAAVLDLTWRRVRRRPAIRVISTAQERTTQVSAAQEGAAGRAEGAAGRQEGAAGRAARGRPDRTLLRLVDLLARTVPADQAPGALAASSGVRPEAEGAASSVSSR